VIEMKKVKLNIILSTIRADELTTFDQLMSHNNIYGDFEIRIDGELLIGAERFASGEKTIGDALDFLMMTRNLNEPNEECCRELLALSGYEYCSKYVVIDNEDICQFTALYDEEIVRGYENIELDLKQVQTELTRFRLEFIELLQKYMSEKAVAAWWMVNAFEYVDDTKNKKGKYSR